MYLKYIIVIMYIYPLEPGPQAGPPSQSLDWYLISNTNHKTFQNQKQFVVLGVRKSKKVIFTFVRKVKNFTCIFIDSCV